MTAPSKSLLDDLSSLTWLPPWAALQPEEAQTQQHRLSNSLSDQHPLHGRIATAVASRTDDAAEVLFVVAGPDELCVVNMDSAGKPSASKPFFMIYASAEEFEQGCMLPDHMEHTDEDV